MHVCPVPLVQVICQLIKRYPHVLLVPLAVLGLLLGVGIWGVHRWQQEDHNQNRWVHGQGQQPGATRQTWH